MVFPSSLMQIGLAGRSTVLKPILWLIASLLSALVGLVYYKADKWILIAVMVFLGLSVFIAICGFCWFAFKNPSELRSENYLLRREEIRMIRGDSLSGSAETDITPRNRQGGRMLGASNSQDAD